MAILGKSQTGAKPLGAYGAIAVLSGTLLLGVAMNGVFLLIPLAYVAAICLLFSRESYGDLKQLATLVPAVIVVSTLLWQEDYSGPSPIPAGIVPIPYRFVLGFLVGVEMSVRALVIVLAVSAFVRTVKVSELSYLLERTSRSKSFSFVFTLAFNIRPYLEGISRETLNAIKLRGGFRLRNLASSVKYFLSSTTLNALGKCQDISYAAEARAFGSARNIASSAGRNRPTPSRTDFVILIATAIVVALSFAVKV